MNNTELTTLLGKLKSNFALLNNKVTKRIRLAIEPTSQCDDVALLVWYALAHWEQNDNGSTDGKVNYLTQENFELLVTKSNKLLNAR
jgi:hypothetical protein